MKVAAFLTLFFLSAWTASAEDLEAFRAGALAEINAFRQEQGRGPVRFDDALNGLSLEWARHLAARGGLVHRGDLLDLIRAHGWGYFNENLHLQSGEPSADASVTAWKNSPIHRANLLAPQVDRIGISVAEAGGVYYAVFNGASGGGGSPSAKPAGGLFGGNPMSR